MSDEHLTLDKKVRKLKKEKEKMIDITLAKDLLSQVGLRAI
jgi:hypothetical protein